MSLGIPVINYFTHKCVLSSLFCVLIDFERPWGFSTNCDCIYDMTVGVMFAPCWVWLWYYCMIVNVTVVMGCRLRTVNMLGHMHENSLGVKMVWCFESEWDGCLLLVMVVRLSQRPCWWWHGVLENMWDHLNVLVRVKLFSKVRMLGTSMVGP